MWLTTDLITDVRRRAMLPASSLISTSDTDILAHAYAEMSSRVIPVALSVNEEFYVAALDVALVSGQQAYRVPDRSIGGRIRDVSLVVGNSVTRLARLEPEKLSAYTTNAVGFPTAFYMDAGAINLVPAPVAAGASLRVRYFVRPGYPSATAAEYAQVGSLSYPSATSVTLNFTPGPTTTNGQTYDVIANRPPFEYLCINGVASGSGAGTVTLTSAGVSKNIQAGDWLTLADKSPVIQAPVELHSWLTQLTVCAILEQLNYQSKLGAAKARAQELEAAALKLITPRTDGSPRKMTGLVNSTGFFGLWGR